MNPLTTVMLQCWPTSPKQGLMPRRRHIRLKLGQQNRKKFNVQSPHHLVHRDASSAGTV
jgi:hypothetical protein